MGLLAGIGFVLPTFVLKDALEARSQRLMLINAGHPVLSLTVAGIILGTWQ